jgi:hypothetical protein
MRRHDTWWYKTYHAIRYDIPRFFKTVWLFRKELYGYYEWDHTYPMNMFKRGLILLSDHIEEHGHEIDTPRKKKVEKMRRSIELLELHTSGDYIEQAEKELGYVCNTEYIFGDGEPKKIKEANRKLYDLSTKIEEETWIELFKILQGQDYKDFGNMFDKNKDLEETALLYDEWFDGSGLKGWWN